MKYHSFQIFYKLSNSSLIFCMWVENHWSREKSLFLTGHNSLNERSLGGINFFFFFCYHLSTDCEKGERKINECFWESWGWEVVVLTDTQDQVGFQAHSSICFPAVRGEFVVGGQYYREVILQILIWHRGSLKDSVVFLQRLCCVLKTESRCLSK